MSLLFNIIGKSSVSLTDPSWTSNPYSISVTKRYSKHKIISVSKFVALPGNGDINDNYLEIYLISSSNVNNEGYSIEIEFTTGISIRMMRISLNGTKENIEIEATLLNDMSRNCELLKIEFNRTSFWFNDDSYRHHYWFYCEAVENNALINKIKINVISQLEFSFDFIRIYLVKDWSEDKSPEKVVCGELQIPYGVMSIKIEKGYIYDLRCAQGFKFYNGNEGNHTCKSYSKKERLLKCYPQKTCPKFENFSNGLVKVHSYKKVFYIEFNDWYAVDRTEALIDCTSDNTFYSKNVICRSNGQWDKHCSKNEGLIKNSIEHILKWWVTTQKWIAESQFLTLSSIRDLKFRR
jgi:hypothetical protein